MKKITKKGIFIDFGRNYCSSKEEVLTEVQEIRKKLERR